MELLLFLSYLLYSIIVFYIIRVGFLLLERKRKKKRIMIILGSGGHTTEMIQMLSKFDFFKYDIVFVIAKTDPFSKSKAISIAKQSNQVIL